MHCGKGDWHGNREIYNRRERKAETPSVEKLFFGGSGHGA
jgi:hypothetical protein